MSNSDWQPDLAPLGPVEPFRVPMTDELRQALKLVGESIEQAREHHARTGEWPPDQMLDEVEEMRRRVEAEHGSDPRQVLEWYIRASKQHIPQQDGASQPVSSAGMNSR